MDTKRYDAIRNHKIDESISHGTSNYLHN